MAVTVEVREVDDTPEKAHEPEGLGGYSATEMERKKWLNRKPGQPLTEEEKRRRMQVH
jgi:hypothetical protein